MVRDGAVVAALALVAVGAWKLRVIAPATVAFDFLKNADFYTQIYPMSHRAAEWIRAGVVPLWNLSSAASTAVTPDPPSRPCPESPARVAGSVRVSSSRAAR